MANQEALQTAHRELVAAYSDWRRAFVYVHSTLRYEDLLPLAEDLDQAFQRFLIAVEPFISPAPGVET